MKAKTKFVPIATTSRQAEVDKTNRLRALRLAKEATEKAEKEASAREAAVASASKSRRRTRAAGTPAPIKPA